ncbi:MAG: Ribonuclease BN [Planctomycetes bacterium]|nr:Ribonuclease BN [Planctomycetota bacterium]
MRVRVLGCSGGCAPGRAPSCYMLDDGIVVDAGAMATALTVEEQQQVTDVLLTHAHWDHVRDLPLATINRGAGAKTLRLHGLAETIRAVRTHLMNGEVWFQAFDLPSADTPFVSAKTVKPGDVFRAGRYTVHCVEVPHTVPAVSYLFDDGTSSLLMNADTGGGIAAGRPSIFANLPKSSPLRAVFLEASFPNRMREFAVMTGHLTPAMLGEEVACLPRDVDVIVTHLKPGFETEMAREIADLGRPGVRPCRDGDVFEW